MTYVYGEASTKEKVGVNPRLTAVADLALVKSFQLGFTDWTIYDGGRTVAEQKEYVRTGASKTMKSKHLEGLAYDLVPWIMGKPRWYWPQIFEIAACMKLAAVELNTPIIWGVVWDRRLNDLAPTVNDPKLLPAALAAEGQAYNKRHVGPDFPDGPHYQLVV
jgi:peptidoglycan L-alanyl-D-glutamate endopeptidase CwlK